MMPHCPSLESPASMLTETIKATFKDAAQKLTGNRKRDFIAKVTEDYLESSARKAETLFGCGIGVVCNSDCVSAGLGWFAWMTIALVDDIKVRRSCPISKLIFVRL
jgi:hypothetical protein